jgi:hypothetical protein
MIGLYITCLEFLTKNSPVNNTPLLRNMIYLLDIVQKCSDTVRTLFVAHVDSWLATIPFLERGFNQSTMTNPEKAVY